LIALVIVYKKLGGGKLSFSLDVAKRMMAKSKYYIIANLMVVVFTQTDRVMLKMMLDSSATGFYSAASTCAQLGNFVFAAIIDSARPAIFEKHKNSINEFKSSMIMLYSVIIYSTLAFGLVVTFLANPIITIVYGEQYSPAIAVLRVIVWFLPFSFIGSVRNVWLLAENKQKWIPVINLSGAVANVAMNFVLIPIWGMVGAGIASLVTQCFSNVFVTHIIRDTRENSNLMIKGLDVRLFVGKLKSYSKKR
jgi:O-antigen/teichoic acid export membrane protein